jgi:protein gp37
LACGRLKKLYLSNQNVIAGNPTDPFAVRWWPARLEEPLRLKKPRRIFVVDMGDLFADEVPVKYIEAVMSVVKRCPQHTFQFVTKRPWNLKTIEWPSNAWVGVTAINREQYSDAIHYLNFVQAGVKFISFEPLLEEVGVLSGDFLSHNIRWVIIGAQTNPTVRPSNKAMQEILVAAKKAKAAVFCKNNLASSCSERAKLPGLCRERKGSLILRQEYPL